MNDTSMDRKYFIDYGTGAGNEWSDTIEEAMRLAEEGLSYTLQPVTIYNEGEEVARLPWFGIDPEEDEVVTSKFGSHGYYGEWGIY